METSTASQPRSPRRWRVFAYTIGLVRFSIIILVATLVLLMVDQGQDLIRTINEDKRLFVFIVGMTLSGFSIWLWARTLLDIRFPSPPYPETLTSVKTEYTQSNEKNELRLTVSSPSREIEGFNFWRKHLPRILGFLSFIAVSLATLKAGAYFLSIVALVVGIIFFGAVIYRRKLANLIAHRVNWFPETERIIPAELPPFKNMSEALQGIRGNIAFYMLLAGFIYFLVGTIYPYQLGKLGAILLFFLWAATFLPLGSYISYLSNMKGIPGLLILFSAAFIFSLWNDNHEIRELKSESTIVRPKLNDVLLRWKEQNCNETSCKPFVVVATAGGGVRAAYWTATILGELENKEKDYHQSIFAISGVSGGSVGATVFHTIATEWDNLDQSKCTKDSNNSIRDCTLNIIGQDTLGSVAASMLSSDIVQRFLPIDFLPDRAEAFEKAWEKNYFALTNQQHLKELSFADLSKKSSAPALFLNSTWTDNGRRIVASTLDFREVKAFERNNDLLSITGKNLSLSTAMHNSARFPLVSPPGNWIVKKDNSDKESDLEVGDIQGRLMDGGLFENYGAETALEILDAGKSVMGDYFNPKIILISSDPSVGEDLAKSPRRKPLSFGYELLSTFSTYANTRVGRGLEAASRLKNYNDEVCGRDNKCNFVHFYMCNNEETKISPPLGWSLSEVAKETILGYLFVDKNPGNTETKCLINNQVALKQAIAWISESK